MEYKDYYSILGVNKTASQDEIKKAYKKLVVKYHPDKNQNNKSAESKFKEINEAYQVLGDAEKRKKYDALGQNWDKFEQYNSARQRQHTGANYYTVDDLSEIFGDIFGKSRASADKRRQKRTTTHFNTGSGFSDFFSAFFGEDFADSSGSGSDGVYDFFTDASKNRSNYQSYAGSDFSDGFSEVGLKDSALDIKADIHISLSEALLGCEKIYNINGGNIKVKIPAGVRPGQRIKLSGLGQRGRAGAGDLYLIVNIINSANFKTEGDDIIIPLYITPAEAALGADLTVDLPIGKGKIKVPECSSGGKRLRLAGKGFKLADKRRGDIYLELRITLPESLTNKERELYNKLRDAEQRVSRRIRL